MIGYEKEKGVVVVVVVVVVVFSTVLWVFFFFFLSLLWFLRVLRLRLVMRVKKKKERGERRCTFHCVRCMYTESSKKKKVLSLFIIAKDREKGKLR